MLLSEPVAKKKSGKILPPSEPVPASPRSGGTKNVKIARDIAAMAVKTAALQGVTLTRHIEPLLLKALAEVDVEIDDCGVDYVAAQANKLTHLADPSHLSLFTINAQLAVELARKAGSLQTSIAKMLDRNLRIFVASEYEIAIRQASKLVIRPRRLAGSLSLPFVGPVAAGTPVEVFDNPHEMVDLGEKLGGEGRYVFVVRGDSMTEERIFDGDSVIIQREPEAESGDTVIARYDGALLLKKMIRRGEKEIRLVSCDGSKRHWVLDPDRGDEILGKFVAVFRTCK